MKVVLCLLTVLGCSIALPSPLQPLAWEGIKGKNVYIDPVSNYTVDAPIDGRIIGDTEVAPNSIAYQVAIFINSRSLCGGSLISHNFVLTAAHCTIDASFVELVFGAHNPQVSETTQVRTTSTHITIHYNYQPATLRNDVSLIQTPSPIETNSYIQIITLAPANSGTFDGAYAFLSGWGSVSDTNNSISSGLRGVYLNVISNDACIDAYGSTVQITNICTSGADVVGACNGDSGGPLVVGIYQVGIVSFVSSGGCESGLPTGYARVSFYKNWIEQYSDVSDVY